MGRQKLFTTDAERQRAYRKRQLALREYWDTYHQPAPAETPKNRRPVPRTKRVLALIAEVQKLQQEYERWHASIPEPLQDSEQATRLSETIEQLATIADMLSDLQLPRGFGRD
jgi:hypothetical protein